MAGVLTASICLFGLTATVAAAPPPDGHNQQQGDGNNGSGNHGGGKQRLEDSKFDGQDGPEYDGRKPTDHPKLDKQLNQSADRGGVDKTRAIIVLKPGCDVDDDVTRLGGKNGRKLGLINGEAVELPNFVLRKLANNPCVAAIHLDRATGGEMNRAAVLSGARSVQQNLGLDGAGVGVAIIDSGIAGWHDDLTYQGANPNVKVVGGQRVTGFVDFVNGRTAAYDDNGHGSHVAGIIAGNGYDTRGARAGMAPAADLISLKVLNDHGGGYISSVIAALDWVVANQAAYNIRVVNLSVGAAVTQSYRTDPLTLATKRVVDTGVVVVCAAGNLGKNPITGKIQYGAITAPGNAPWVLTVGASSHMGTIDRADDTMAAFSSHGPTAKDYLAKPDVVATGVGIVSLAVPGSTFYTTRPTYLLDGSIATANKPYLSLTGTSMAAPMVTGTIALMVQANPKLTPNMAKAIIEYTAQNYGYDPLTQGAGFLNTKGAVQLAKFLYTAKAGDRYPSHKAWSKTVIWGNRKLKGGVIKPAGTAWATDVVWGATLTPMATNIVWGTACDTVECDNIVWGTALMDADNIVWGTYAVAASNIVWGTAISPLSSVVWGTACGAVACDNIVWGTACGLLDCDNIVWGTSLGVLATNIVWGTALAADNIVWGTTGVVPGPIWSSSAEADNITWGSSGTLTPLFDDPAVPSVFDATAFDALLDASVALAPTVGAPVPVAPAPVAPTPPPPPPSPPPAPAPAAILPAPAPAVTAPIAPVVGGL
jgi:serine protease AprX